VDLLKVKAFSYDQKTPDGAAGDVPAELQDQVEEFRGQLIEAAAEGDDALLEKYLEGGELDEKEIASGLAAAVAAGSTAPVLVASATHLVGVDLLAHAISALAPAPVDRAAVKGASKPGGTDEVERKPSADEPLSAFVFKTISD